MRLSALAGAIAALLAVAAPAGGGTVPGAVAPASADTFLSGVSCPAASFCMAVGASTGTGNARRTLAERWDGSSWHIVATFNLGGPRSGDELLSVSCASASSCVAVGDAFGASVPLAEVWDGAGWSLVGVPVPRGARRASLQSVSCAAPSACLAAGSVNDSTGLPPRTLIERWNGLGWAVMPSPNPRGAAVSDLWGISCASATACTAVGDTATSTPGSETTLVERWSGASWQVVASPGVPGRQSALFAVDCAAAARCTAGGASYSTSGTFTGRPLAETDSTGVWQALPTPHPPHTFYDQLEGMACTGAARCIAVGAAQSATAVTTLVESANAGPWSIVPSPNPAGPLSALNALSCPAATWCMAVGAHIDLTGRKLPFSERWNGSTWAIVPVPNP